MEEQIQAIVAELELEGHYPADTARELAEKFYAMGIRSVPDENEEGIRSVPVSASEL